tara:strand:- start:291 stop:695 length:405 start_codon:yes stop_codon:yes gene_type:complete
MPLSEQEAAKMRELVSGFFDAVGAGDIEAVKNYYDDDLVVWHNFDNAEQTKAENIASLASIPDRLRDRVYANRQVEVFEGGFVQQHVLIATRIFDGARIEMPAIIICRVRNGKIIRLDEYLDSAHVAELRKVAP